MANEISERRVMEAVFSFIVPGFGQLLQMRLGMALLLFFGSLIAWPVAWWLGAGMLMHLYSAYDAATWKGEA